MAFVAKNGEVSVSGLSANTTTLTIPITTAVTTGEMLLIVVLCGSTTDNISAFSPASCVDSKSLAWHSLATVGRIIGAINQEAAGGDLYALGVSYRPVTPGADLGIGDTVTVQITSTSGKTNKFFTAVVLEFAGTDFTITSQSWDGTPIPSTVLSNGDSYPDEGTSTALSWDADYAGFNFARPSPDADAILISVAGAYPAQPGGHYTPDIGTVVAQADDVSSLRIIEQTLVTANTVIDPGGTWDSAATRLVGNYQFLTPAPLSTGLHIWQRT